MGRLIDKEVLKRTRNENEVLFIVNKKNIIVIYYDEKISTGSGHYPGKN